MDDDDDANDVYFNKSFFTDYAHFSPLIMIVYYSFRFIKYLIERFYVKYGGKLIF